MALLVSEKYRERCQSLTHFAEMDGMQNHTYQCHFKQFKAKNL